MNLPDEELFHFTLTGIASKKKTVKIPPGLRMGWILSPFKATGHLKLVNPTGSAAAGEVLDLYKTPEEHVSCNFKPGKQNRVDLEFVAASASSRGSSQTPRSRPSTPSAARDATTPNKERSSSSAGGGNNKDKAAAPGPRPQKGVNFSDPDNATQAPQQVRVGTPTPVAGGAATTSSTGNSTKATPTAGASMTGRSGQQSSSAAGTPSASTPKMAGSAALANARQQQQQPSDGSLQRQPSLGGSTSSANISKMASSSNFARDESNTFNVIGGVATLQRPRAAHEKPSAENKLAATANEEVVEVTHGDSLSRVSSTLNTPKTGNTPSGSPARTGLSAANTPKAASPAKARAQQQQSQQYEQPREQQHHGENYASHGSSRGRATPVRMEEPLEHQRQQHQQHQHQAGSSNSPVVVAYVQLPDGRREPVYYKEGAAKPVFLVNNNTAAAPGSTGDQTFLISTPRSAVGGADNTTTSSSNAPAGRFGSTPNSQRPPTSTNRFSSPSLQQQQPVTNFFDQDMHNLADSALHPMSSTEINEQVNELRTILFSEQQRREELENRLTHLFGVADSWATLRHSLQTVTAGSNNDSRTGSAYGAADTTPRNVSLFNPVPSYQQQGGSGGGIQRLSADEAAVLAEHERQLEELRRQRMVLTAQTQHHRRTSPQSAAAAEPLKEL